MRDHITALRANLMWQDVPIIFIPEKGYGLADNLYQYISDFPLVQLFYEKEGKPGAVKTHARTMDYKTRMSAFLYREQIKFHFQGFSRSGKRFDKMKSLLAKQAELYRFVVKKGKVSLSGKVRDSRGTSEDDLLVTVMMALYWGNNVMMYPDVRRFVENGAITRTATHTRIVPL